MTRYGAIGVCILSAGLLRAAVASPAGPASAPTSAPSIAPPVVRETYLDDVRAELRLQYPKNRTVNIVCHGHSVPAGYFRTPEVRSLDAYPHLLRKDLAAAFPSAVVNVIVTAIGGENSESGAERFERDVLSLRPSVVTIDYGLNDRRLGVERAGKAWERMIGMAKGAGAKVILLTPTGDLTAKMADPADPLNRHAELIRELARRHQVGLVDSLAAFKRYVDGGRDLEDLMSQRNHPNAKGHALVAEALARWFTREGE